MIEEEIPFVFDTLALEIPPRTSLFRLEPIGIGTPEVESFASWLTRLARAHRIGVRTLLLQILPEEERKHAASGTSGRWRVRSNLLNVPGRIAPWLAKATGVRDLSLLSLERWLGLISCIGLLRQRRAWCPACLRQSPHERLAWTMQGVVACPTHRTRLLECCQFCGFAPSRLRLGSNLNGCPRCGRWMELSGHGEPISSEWDSHFAREAGALAAAAKGSGGNSPMWIAAGIRNALPTWPQGEICRLLGVHDNRFALLRTRNRTVSFEFLCRVSFALGISVPTLLTVDPDGWIARTPRRGDWTPTRRVLVENDREALSERLQCLVREGCLSLRQASIQLGRSRETLLRHFPVESEQLLNRSSTERRGMLRPVEPLAKDKAPRFPLTAS